MPGTVATGHPLARPRERKAHPTPLLRTILGMVLRRTRQEQDRTLREVAQTARVSIAYLSELERGRKEASSEVLAAICDALQIDLAELLTEVGRVLASTHSHAGRQSLVRAGVAPQVRRAVARPDNVVRLAEFRGRRAQQVPRARAHRVRDSGVVLLRAA